MAFFMPAILVGLVLFSGKACEFFLFPRPATARYSVGNGYEEVFMSERRVIRRCLCRERPVALSNAPTAGGDV